MNYCTIQEAWGQGNYISNQYKKHDNNRPNMQKKSIENSENNNMKIAEPFENSYKNNKNKRNNKLNCNNFFTHIENCRHCQIKMRDHFKPKILENFEDIIQTNRDIIVLILIGLCFMIFFNMITNITSDNKKN
jgi:hypothetical protein